MTTLAITRGLPASGKTTLARQWVSKNSLRRARLNRDDMRQTLFGQTGILDRTQEDAITKAQHAQATALLKAGWSVIIDDTNLRLRYANAWATLADDLGAAFEVIEVDTPVEECILRDLARGLAGGRQVGGHVIEELHLRFTTRPDVKPVAKVKVFGEPYTPDPTKPAAVIVDIDGTLAHMNGRGPYDDHLVHTALLDETIALLIDNWRYANGLAARVVLCSGRDEKCRDVTEAWLDEHGIHYDELLMRPRGDNRNDAIVKRELFDTHIRHQYRVAFVLDDRNRVVDMWRGLGLKCLQVAPGDF